MRKNNVFRATSGLGMIFLGALLAGSASAASSGPQIAGYCLLRGDWDQVIYHSAIFQKNSTYFDRDGWRDDFRSHLQEIGVKTEGKGVACRVWKGAADALAVAIEEEAKVPTDVANIRIVRIDWAPEDTLRAFGRRTADKPTSTPRKLEPSPKPAVASTPREPEPKPTVASTKYVEVPGPNGTIRLSPEVAARNQAAAEEYRRKMEAHARAKADHDRKLAEHQQNAATAAAAKRAHELKLAANAAEVAAHDAAMDDYKKKLAGKASTDDDPNRCITSPAIKPGLRGNTEVHVTNGCDQKVDVVICLKRTTGDWLCGANFGILPQRSMSFMSTNATGEIYVDAVTFGSNNKLGRPAGIIK